jgi:hypothetical protein
MHVMRRQSEYAANYPPTLGVACNRIEPMLLVRYCKTDPAKPVAGNADVLKEIPWQAMKLVSFSSRHCLGKRFLHLTKADWQTIGKQTGWHRQAGADWLVTDKVKQVVRDLAAEARSRGGTVQKLSENTAEITMPIEYKKRTVGVSLKIRLYEDSRIHDLVVSASFVSSGQDHSISVNHQPPIASGAQALDAVVDGFHWILNSPP